MFFISAKKLFVAQIRDLSSNTESSSSDLLPAHFPSMPEKAVEKPQPGVRYKETDVQQRRLCLQTTARVSGQISVAATTPLSRQASASTQTPTTSPARSQSLSPARRGTRTRPSPSSGVLWAPITTRSHRDGGGGWTERKTEGEEQPETMSRPSSKPHHWTFVFWTLVMEPHVVTGSHSEAERGRGRKHRPQDIKITGTWGT